jgi:iron-sulfur cluster repair protein YtfE (RIC family)
MDASAITVPFLGHSWKRVYWVDEPESAQHLPPVPMPASPAPAGAPPLFSGASRRADLVAAYPDLDALCDRLSFGWDMTLESLCSQSDWALLELARAAKPPRQARQADWSMATMSELVGDILITHHLPLRSELRRIDILIHQFCRRHPELAHFDLHGVYARLADGLNAHLDHEEGVVFPLGLAIERASRHPGQDVPASSAVTGAIRYMALGHQDAAQAIRRLLVVLRQVQMNTFDTDLGLISDALAAMLADLTQHEDKEDGILMPAVIFADELLRSRAAAPASTSHGSAG